MQLLTAKSQQMVVGRHGCETGENLVLGGDKLQQVCTVSHLGLTLASTLKWSDHLSGILKRAAPKAAALKKLGYRARVSVDTMSLLYKTILGECKALWGELERVSASSLL